MLFIPQPPGLLCTVALLCTEVAFRCRCAGVCAQFNCSPCILNDQHQHAVAFKLLRLGDVLVQMHRHDSWSLLYLSLGRP